MLIILQILLHFTNFSGHVVFIITSYLASVESRDQCLLSSEVLSCFSGVIINIRSFFVLLESVFCIIGEGHLLQSTQNQKIKSFRVFFKLLEYCKPQTQKNII